MVYLGWEARQEPDGGPLRVLNTESLQRVRDQLFQGVRLLESSHHALPSSVLHSQCHRRHFTVISLGSAVNSLKLQELAMDGTLQICGKIVTAMLSMRLVLIKL